LLKFNPVNVAGLSVNTKRHILEWERVLWATVRQSRPTGHFSRRSGENIQKMEKTRPYISRICPDFHLDHV